MSISRALIAAAIIFVALLAAQALPFMKNGSRLVRGLTAGAILFVVLLLLNGVFWG